MALRSISNWGAALFCVANLMIGQTSADALQLSFCSKDNTAKSSLTYWEWQSNGWCSDYCRDQGSALAIVQYTSCWCSDLVPADTTDTSACEVDCPGYPAEKCGDIDAGTFGYIQLAPPSGTVGGSEPTSARSSSHPTVVKTVTQDASVVTSTVSPSSTKTSSTSTSKKEQPVTQEFTTQSLFTVSGDIVTQTVIATSVVTPKGGDGGKSSAVSTGAIAGGVVGGVGGLALLIGGVLFFFWRRRRQQASSQYGGSEAGNSGVTRNTSVLSKTGLLGSAEKSYMGPVHTSSHRSNNGMDLDNTTPISERRNSKPLFYDQRLNPSALMDNDNNSRASIGTMQDNRDYTRTLNVRNPDPDSDVDEPDYNFRPGPR